MNYRGSRKHIMDWTGFPAEQFASEMTQLVQPSGVIVSADDRWMPKGSEAPDEAKLDEPNIPFLNADQKKQLKSWWLEHPHGANVPNWDLVSTCRTSDGRDGLILVEAKAHHNELKRDGKTLAEGASPNSQANHRHIGQAIDDACQNLCRTVNGVNICRDSHYQLANRIATSWFLTSVLGIPTVLVYLGFCGDADIADQGEPFSSDADWQKGFRDHAQGILPEDFYERSIEDKSAPLWMLIRSRSILSNAPSSVSI